MDVSANQKILYYRLPFGTNALGEINAALAEGYEITDITPDLRSAGGAVFNRVYGIYTDSVLITLTPSSKKQALDFQMIRKEQDWLPNYTSVVQEENGKGFVLYKTLSYNGWFDPEAGQGIGRGTYGFAMFFTKSE